MAGACRYYGCTEAKACPEGCAWANAEQTVCTACADVADTARELVRLLGLTAGPRAFTLPVADFDLLPADAQAGLVQLCRGMVDSIRAGLLEAMEAEAVAAIRELDAISSFLLEHCAAEIQEDDSTADVALRLLKAAGRSPLVLHDGGAR